MPHGMQHQVLGRNVPKEICYILKGKAEEKSHRGKRWKPVRSAHYLVTQLSLEGNSALKLLLKYCAPSNLQVRRLTIWFWLA